MLPESFGSNRLEYARKRNKVDKLKIELEKISQKTFSRLCLMKIDKYRAFNSAQFTSKNVATNSLIVTAIPAMAPACRQVT